MNNQVTNWVVYILKCADGTFYTGSTNNLVRRIKTHSSGQGAKYTRSRLPVKLVFTEEKTDKSSALKKELKIKRMTRLEKQRLIDSALG